KVYGAALLRMREDDFGEVQHYGGVSPAWPICYRDLEPYYTQAEELYSVHGQRGADPFDPPATRAYPNRALPHEQFIQDLYEDLKGIGHRPFPLPIGVRLGNGDTPKAPYRLSNFDGFPDLTEVKADAHVVAIQPALAHPNVSILTDGFVERLVTSTTGREVT